MWWKIRHPSELLERLAKSSRPMVSKARLVPSILDHSYRATIKTVVFAIGIVLIVATVKAIFGNHIVIEPISVPRTLEEDGYSGAVVSRLVLAQVRAISRSGNVLHVGKPSSEPAERVSFRSEDDFASLATIQVPSSSVTLRSMALMLRDFLGIPERRISGEIIIKRPTDRSEPVVYAIALHFGSPTDSFTSSKEADNVVEAIRLSAPSIAERFDPVGLAAFYFENRKWTEMKQVADRLTSQADLGGRKEGLFLLGLRSLAFQMNEEAIEFFRRATKEDDGFSDAYNSWGAALANLKRYDEAIEKYDQTIRLNPFNHTAFFNRALAYDAKGEIDRTIQDYTQVVTLDPQNASALNNRGNAYRDKHQYDRAIQDYNRALEIDPKFVWAYSNRSNVHRDKREFDLAIQDADRAIEINSNFAAAFSSRGFAYRGKGENDRAIQDYSRAIELGSKDAELFNNRCYARAILGQLDSAIADCNEAIRLMPDNAECFDSRGFAYLKLKKFDQAIADFDAALNIDPNKAGTLFQRGIAKHNKGDTVGGDADIAAAKKLKADIASDMAKLGVQI
jgi:tetratricopeptide (TPR) repeat protein